MPISTTLLRGGPELRNEIVKVLKARPSLAFEAIEIVAEINRSSVHAELLSRRVLTPRVVQLDAPPGVDVFQQALAELVASNEIVRVEYEGRSHFHYPPEIP